jgi:hypothetical protein
MTQPEPFRYIDADGFCLSVRLLPDLNTGGVTDTLSVTVEGSDEPQSAHIPTADVDQVVAGIYTAAGRKPPRLDPIQECDTCGAGYDLGHPCQACAFNTRMAAEQAARSL